MSTAERYADNAAYVEAVKAAEMVVERLMLLQDAIRQIESMEGKMIAREALTPVEQAKYDMASRQNLEEKVQWLQASMKEQVAAGALSNAERDTVLREMEERLKALLEEQEKAVADGHEKAAPGLLACLAVARPLPPLPPSRGPSRASPTSARRAPPSSGSTSSRLRWCQAALSL